MSRLKQALSCSHEFGPLKMSKYESHGDDAYVVQRCTDCHFMVKIEYRLRKVMDQTGKEHAPDDIGRCCSKQDLTTVSAVFYSGIDRIVEHMKCQNCSMLYILEFQFVEFYTDEDEEKGMILTYENGILLKKLNKAEQVGPIKCQNEDCEFYNKSERQGGAFIAVVYYMETRDFEVSDDGTIGTDLTLKENEDLHIGFRVRDVRCRHCDEEITFPTKWEKIFDDTLPEDFTTIGVTKNVSV